jgi:hypothetical protein
MDSLGSFMSTSQESDESPRWGPHHLSFLENCIHLFIHKYLLSDYNVSRIVTRWGGDPEELLPSIGKSSDMLQVRVIQNVESNPKCSFFQWLGNQLSLYPSSLQDTRHQIPSQVGNRYFKTSFLGKRDNSTGNIGRKRMTAKSEALREAITRNQKRNTEAFPSNKMQCAKAWFMKKTLCYAAWGKNGLNHERQIEPMSTNANRWLRHPDQASSKALGRQEFYREQPFPGENYYIFYGIESKRLKARTKYAIAASPERHGRNWD